MWRFLWFRLGCHELSIAAGRVSGVPSHDSICMCCSTGALGMFSLVEMPSFGKSAHGVPV